MNKVKLIISLVLLCSVVTLSAQIKHNTTSLYPTYKGLVMCGYQGWFRAQGDGANESWVHFGRGGNFDLEHNTIDFWPDVSEYEKTYKTSFKHKDGTTASVFSSLDKSTTNLHFKWMKEYGIDGVFMQRFFRVTREYDKDKSQNIILSNALDAAEKHGRAIAVMYDLSGLRPEGEDCSAIIEDWKNLVEKMKVTSRNNNYLFHNGKPLVTIWGLGFPDRPYNIRNIKLEELIDFLKNDPEYGGCSVMLGVPTYFRTLTKDCITDPYLHDLIRKADIVLPWMVGRYSSKTEGYLKLYKENLTNDIQWCKNNEVDYTPIIYPGFSWANLKKGETEYGAIPRLGGKFYWELGTTAILSGAEMIYVAMFDEIDEGTAIMKVSDNPPNTNGAHFVDNDGMPSDHYLFLTGELAKILRSEKPVNLKMPIR